MKISFESRCIIELDHVSGCETSKHLATKVNLIVSKNLDDTHYVDENGLPTEFGFEALTNNFIQGLVCNIHVAHEKGFRNDAEHLRFIISELERGFIENVKMDIGTF